MARLETARGDHAVTSDTIMKLPHNYYVAHLETGIVTSDFRH
jgi:hypothetical protein